MVDPYFTGSEDEAVIEHVGAGFIVTVLVVEVSSQPVSTLVTFTE